MISVWLLASVLLLPADRLSMADRLFNRGRYQEAEAEYRLLAKESALGADAILFRLAECDRAQGRKDAAQKRFTELAQRFPASEYAARSRLQVALSSSGAERLQLFKELLNDRVETGVRAAALYHLGRETKSVRLLAAAVSLDPKGPYADYARLEQATLLAESSETKVQRKGMELLLNLGFGNGKLAETALYQAAVSSYRSQRYDQAGSLFRRYRRNFPNGPQAEECRTMSVWCDFLNGRYADAAAACGEGATDDFAYLKACCAQALSAPNAASLLRRYLDAYPAGRYRQEAELRLSRLEFAEASRGTNLVAAVESARRIYAQSQLSADALRLGWACERAGIEREAEAVYAEIVKKSPGSSEAAEALYAAAMLSARRHEWARTEIQLAEALASGKLGPREASARYWRGMAAKEIGHAEEAASFLQSALKLGLGLDESREARLVLAEFDYKAGRVESAKAEYAKLVKEGATARMNASLVYAVGKLLDGEARAICAQSLIDGASPEWRQLGWKLKGELEESRQGYTAAIAAYRAALKEPVRTTAAAEVALALGRLESRAGEYAKAEITLCEAVTLSADAPRLRVEAYLALAENAEARKDYKSACGYATVVTSLFDDAEITKRAERILKSHPEVQP